MAKTDLLKTIDQRNWGVDDFYQDNTLDPALTKTPDAPTGVSVAAMVDGILIKIDYDVDTSHDSVANFEGYVVYARPQGDTAESAAEIGRIPYGMTTWAWQPSYGGYTGWDIALTGISNTGYESAKGTWQRAVISTFWDNFARYARADLVDISSVYTAPLESFEDFSDGWSSTIGTGADDTTNFVEGNQGISGVTYGSGGYSYFAMHKTVAWDMTVLSRFDTGDFVCMAVFVAVADPAPTHVKVRFATNLNGIDGAVTDDYYVGEVAPLANGWNYLAVKKSAFTTTGSPNWADINYINLEFRAALGEASTATATFDDLRIVKADPADADAFNDTGAVWDFNGGTWHVYPGNRTGEPDQPFTLGQIQSGATDYFFATAQNVNVPNGRLSSLVQFKAADGVAGLHFHCADDTLSSEDCMAVLLDTAADKIWLVEWTAGGDAAVTNAVLNPSAEAANNFAAVSTATVTRDTAQARRGSNSYKVVTTATADEGISLTLSALANAIHYASYWVYDSTTTPNYDPFAPAEVSLDNTNWHVPEVLETGEGWARYGVQIPAAQANGSTTLYIRQSDATARTLYIDSVQVEAASTATPYADGSLGLGYSWSGTANASTSARVAGSPTTITSAAYTMAADTEYWLGVDFRDPDHEHRANVYVGTSQDDLFTAAALKISDASRYEWPDGGELGLVAGDCNVRFGEFRAGSPQTADYAHRAGMANALSEERYGFKYLLTPLTSTAWDGDAKVAGDSGVIDLSAVFGVPAKVKAVIVRLLIKDEEVGIHAGVRPAGSGSLPVDQYTQVANVYNCVAGICPCDVNGDIYFYTIDELDEVILQIWGYAF